MACPFFIESKLVDLSHMTAAQRLEWEKQDLARMERDIQMIEQHNARQYRWYLTIIAVGVLAFVAFAILMFARR